MNLICLIFDHRFAQLAEGDPIKCQRCGADWPWTISASEKELALEVLAARRRLGEAIWTFKTLNEPALRSLEADGLVFVMHGVVEDTVRAGLTAEGATQVLSDSYVAPRDREAAERKHAEAHARSSTGSEGLS